MIEGNTEKIGNINNLVMRLMTLEEQIRLLESEKSFLSAKSAQLEVEKEKLKNELDELKKHPFIIGEVEEIIKEKEIIVRNGNNIKFLIQLPQKFKKKIALGDRAVLAQRTLSLIKILSKEKDYNVRAMELLEKPLISFKDVGGLKEIKLELEEALILPLTKPNYFKRLGIKPPSGVLLFGEPGTGKTLLVKAIANQTHATFIKITASELVQKFIGEGARLVRELFRLAQEKKPSIIFIDEIDAIASERSAGFTSGEREVNRTLMQLLSELDGFNSRDKVMIVAATNRLDIIDPALIRPGRFDRLIEVHLPDFNERIEILKIHSREMNLAKNVDFKKYSKKCDGLSGADLKLICIEAGIFALRDKAKKIENKHFLKAINKITSKEPDTSNELKMFV